MFILDAECLYSNNVPVVLELRFCWHCKRFSHVQSGQFGHKIKLGICSIQTEEFNLLKWNKMLTNGDPNEISYPVHKIHSKKCWVVLTQFWVKHSKKCWVVLTQFWVKYGHTQPLG